MSLEQLRAEIDRIDDEIIALLEERIEIAKKIGSLKTQLNKEVYHPQREEEILNRLEKMSSLSSSQISRIYKQIFALTKEFQEEDL